MYSRKSSSKNVKVNDQLVMSNNINSNNSNPNNINSNFKKPTCHKCGWVGHMKRECRTKPENYKKPLDY